MTFDGGNEAAKKFFAIAGGRLDREGTALTDFLRRQFIESLIAGASYVLVDFPRASRKAGTRAEEDALGASRAYLVDYAADDVINWSLDDHGNYEWVVIRTKSIKKDRVEDPEWRTETRWAYYDKQTFRIYEKNDGESAVKLVDQGTHGLAKLGQVPLFALRIPEGLWMLNRAGLAATGALQQIERAGVGADDGAVRDAGGVFGSRVEPDGGRELLHPAGAGGQVRVDGAGGQGLSDRGGQPDAAAGRDLPGVLSAHRRAGRWTRARRQRALSKQTGFFDHAGGAASVRGRGEGADPASAAGDRGGAARTGSR